MTSSLFARAGSNTAGIERRQRPGRHSGSSRWSAFMLSASAAPAPAGEEATVAVLGGGAAGGSKIALAITPAPKSAGGARAPDRPFWNPARRSLAATELPLPRERAPNPGEAGDRRRTGQRVAALTRRRSTLKAASGCPPPHPLAGRRRGLAAVPGFQAAARRPGVPADRRCPAPVADPRIFAAGDCAPWQATRRLPRPGSTPCARRGPLGEPEAAVQGGEPPRYQPRGFLSILNTGDGRALLDYKAIVSHSRWAWRLKDRVDRRFMARYQELVC